MNLFIIIQGIFKIKNILYLFIILFYLLIKLNKVIDIYTIFYLFKFWQ